MQWARSKVSLDVLSRTSFQFPSNVTILMLDKPFLKQSTYTENVQEAWALVWAGICQFVVAVLESTEQSHLKWFSKNFT